MAERKSGPVKPPVIDLKAREAAGPPETEAQGSVPGEAEATARRQPSRRGTRSRSAATKPTESAKPVESAEAASVEGSTDASAADHAGPEPTGDAPTSAAEPGDGEADQRETGAPAEPLAEHESGPASTIPPPPPRPPARLAMPWSAISIAAIVGAVLGAGLTYLAANWIALPRQEPPYPDPTPALTDLVTAVEALGSRLAAVEQTARTTRVSLDATLAQFDTATAELRQQIADVEAAIPEPQIVDLSAIENELQTLEGRVAAIAAGASSDDAAVLANSLAGIETTLDAVSERLDSFESRVAEGDGRLAALAAGLEEARTAIAAQTRTLGGTEIGPAVKLPLIVSGLEAAFANGRPYAAELDGLTTLLPDLSVPPVIESQAVTGLARPDALAARFDRSLPDIIAGRTHESSGDLAQDAIEWAKALLALRPADEIEGDTPEAIVSRLEAAVDRRDFVAAARELAQLPAPMRDAAGDVGADITAHAQAADFIARLRAEALAPATEPAS